MLILFQKSELNMVVGNLFFKFFVVLPLDIKNRLESAYLITKGGDKLALLRIRLRWSIIFVIKLK